jgi:Tfp pilus assembly protein PilV
MAKLNARSSTTQSAGLTLIGVMVATLIFALVLIATFNLMARTTRESGRSREIFTATNLAREGLELVQQVRDTNMLRCPKGTVDPKCTPDFKWTDNFYGVVKLCADDSANRRLFVDRIDTDVIASGVLVQELSSSASASLFLNGDRYQHAPTATSTPYSRRIEIDCTNHNQQAIGDEHIIVTSIVTWSSRNDDHEVRLSNQLYHWYQ